MHDGGEKVQHQIHAETHRDEHVDVEQSIIFRRKKSNLQRRHQRRVTQQHHHHRLPPLKRRPLRTHHQHTLLILLPRLFHLSNLLLFLFAHQLSRLFLRQRLLRPQQKRHRIRRRERRARRDRACLHAHRIVTRHRRLTRGVRAETRATLHRRRGRFPSTHRPRRVAVTVASRARERRTAHERSKSPAHAFVVSSRRPRASRTHDDARECGDAPAAHFRLNGENVQNFWARERKTKSLAMGACGWEKRERARSDE